VPISKVPPKANATSKRGSGGCDALTSSGRHVIRSPCPYDHRIYRSPCPPYARQQKNQRLTHHPPINRRGGTDPRGRQG
jgi:hypothetical protein